MLYKKLFALIFLLVLSFTVSGCLKVNTGQNNKNMPDGGLFVSLDKGESWQQRTAIMGVGGKANNFSFDSSASMALDPSDPRALYFGLVNNGLLSSYNRGESWQLAYDLGPGTVSAIAVDPKNKCTVYVSIRNDLNKTIDCGRSWKPIFTDTVANTQITAVAVDHFNTENIFISLSRGDIVKSSNRGDSWQTLKRFESLAKNLVIDPNDSRRMYVYVNRKGLFKSDDSGQTWEDINAPFVENKINGEIVDIELVKGQPNLVWAATPLGILKSSDRAKTWELMNLLPPKNNAFIASMVVNPKDINQLYYITNNTFYKSIDGGANWSPRPIPSTKKSKILMMDLEKPEILYLGMSL
jgi:photosystem II stability/assembly factor-like uncharacterized protein